MIKNKKVIIFDLDGTLIDSVNIFNEAYSDLLKQVSDVNVSIKQLQEDWSYFADKHKEGDLYDKFLVFIDEKYSVKKHDLAYLKSIYEEIEYKCISEKIEYKPYAKELVLKLKELGYILVLATMSPKYTLDIYNDINKNLNRDLKIYETFDLILMYEDIKNKKPNPEIYNKVIERLNVSKEECVIIEDSLEGVKAACNAGIDVINLVEESMTKFQEEIDNISTYKVDSLKEILDLF